MAGNVQKSIALASCCFGIWCNVLFLFHGYYEASGVVRYESSSLHAQKQPEFT